MDGEEFIPTDYLKYCTKQTALGRDPVVTLAYLPTIHTKPREAVVQHTGVVVS